MSGKTCNKCDVEIKSGKIVTFQDQPYHPKCFVCHGCHEELQGSIRQHEGKNFCELCFSVSCAKRCGKCYKPLTETGVSFVVYGEQTFHPDCFTCNKCRDTLAGKKFYNDPAEGKICEGCM